MRFKQHQNYHFLKKQGESASADEVAAAKFHGTLAKNIEENRFLPEQMR